MILEVFTLFVILALILIGVGLFQKETVFSIIGFSFFFVLGVVLFGGVGSIVGTVEYQVGENITMVNDTLTTVSYDYVPLNDGTTLWFGRFLAMAGAFGIVFTLFRLPSFVERRRKEKRGDETYE